MQMLLLLRGFVVLGVMLMHTAWFFQQAANNTWETVSVMILDIISLFAVPLFMFVSGYLFISRHGHADMYGRDFCKKMFLSVLSPYLLFSLLYIIGTCWFNHSNYSAADIVWMMATGSAAVHMVFFRALFGFYVFYPFIIRCFKYCHRKKYLLLYFVAVIFLQILWKSLNNITFSEHITFYFILVFSFLRYIAYFSFGMATYLYHRRILKWIGQYYARLNLLLVLFVPAIGGCWFARYYLQDYRILEFICFPLNLFLYTILIAMLFFVASHLVRKNNFGRYAVAYLGNYSFGIFLLHVIFMCCGDRLLLLAGITPDRLIFYPLLFAMMLTLSILAMEIIIHLPCCEYLVGKVSKVHTADKEAVDLGFLVRNMLQSYYGKVNRKKHGA